MVAPGPQLHRYAYGSHNRIPKDVEVVFTYPAFNNNYCFLSFTLTK